MTARRPGASGEAPRRLVGYGPSYMVGVGASQPSRGFMALVADASGLVLDSRATSGATAVENFYDAYTSVRGHRWAPDPHVSVVLIEPVVNCVQLFGSAARGKAAMLQSTRALVSLVRSSQRRDVSHDAFTFEGAWASETGYPHAPARCDKAGDGVTDRSRRALRADPTYVAKSTAEAGACVSYEFQGSAATVILVAHDASPGECANGRVGVSIDGGLERTHDVRDQAISYTPGSEDGAHGNRIFASPYPLAIQGLPPGRHTVRVRNLDAGSRLVVDGALVPSDTPPHVLLIQDAGRPDWASSEAGGSNAVQDAYNALLCTIAEEFGAGVDVVLPDPAWDAAVHMDLGQGDGKHPSDAGHAIYAARILQRLGPTMPVVVRAGAGRSAHP